MKRYAKSLIDASAHDAGCFKFEDSLRSEMAELRGRAGHALLKKIGGAALTPKEERDAKMYFFVSDCRNEQGAAAAREIIEAKVKQIKGWEGYMAKERQCTKCGAMSICCSAGPTGWAYCPSCCDCLASKNPSPWAKLY